MNNIKIFKILLKQGSDCNVEYKNGDTILIDALKNNKTNFVDLILDPTSVCNLLKKNIL